ncbi:MAG: glutaminyl-peptide cyclotransferase [Flavobacteriaceae bacterium]|jgi:glutamine cyclotransferase|nr:glutaminyl-peptide cyclotransferase [Flavobacteriaceae bacterium]
MKNYNTLSFLTLAIAFTACGEQKNLEKNVLSINTSSLKQLYHSNEALKLSLNLAENTKLDSVTYFLNNTKIGTVKGNEVLDYNLSNQPLGKTTIKGVAYANDSSVEVSNTIEVASGVTPKLLNYKIINTYPHDKTAYTQGLEFHNGILYESTGNGEGGALVGTQRTNRGISSVRQVDYKTGKVIKIHEFPSDIFGEGCTILNNKLYQLTYKNNKGHIFNPETLTLEGTFDYFQNMEGWGLTNDGTYLYMTDGSEKIYKLDAKTFQKVSEVSVYTDNGPVPYVNELEWVNGKIYANFYGIQAVIAIIDPKTGTVESVIDFSKLVDQLEKHPDLDVFNGIAYNPQTKTFFVTGKNWDKMFEVQIIE